MDIYATLFEVLDTRSFSNMWYWIGLAILWSTASHFVLGVPFDLALKAKRQGGERMQDLEDMVRINTGRLLNIAEVSGLLLTALAATVITLLGVTGFFYGVEFSQAVFLMLFPMAFVGALNIRTAHNITTHTPKGEALISVLRRHRFLVQLIGMVSIFVTAMWGMYQNIVTGPLGG
ncbi:MAG: component of SufBCD complex [Alphaproteobacteria bacterium]|nr:component of SufBCD complex [Alphaproteobacteria bacterium]MBU1280475.1 component of SufBCD complex [Alphaproteobacteria bacterium]MBU1572241.1 component of SufBCD complex [Alphaproteobacteria bacterium]MBU1829814.1 component of SufBCD complex [Alphaproteobacteria bacterium]MBU2078443.1 component of SufBCD complex [Alphaproteobacteria bacterium]